MTENRGRYRSLYRSGARASAEWREISIGRGTHIDEMGKDEGAAKPDTARRV